MHQLKIIQHGDVETGSIYNYGWERIKDSIHV